MMTSSFIKTGAGFLVLGAFAFTAPALALSPLPLNSVPIVVPVEDVESEELKRDLETGDMAPDAEGKAEEEKSSGDVEDEEVWRDLQTGDTPPPGR